MPTQNQIEPEDWLSVRVLAEAAKTTPAIVYGALYDKDDPMPCARRGRAIRVRLADWREWWARRMTTIQPGSPARAPRRAKGVQP